MNTYVVTEIRYNEPTVTAIPLPDSMEQEEIIMRCLAAHQFLCGLEDIHDETTLVILRQDAKRFRQRVDNSSAIAWYWHDSDPSDARNDAYFTIVKVKE